MKTKDDIINAISNVQHPAIAFSLLDLGIVKDIELNKNMVTATFAFPFPNIPIADRLINSISIPVKSLGFDFDYSVDIMTEKEKTKFIQMENQAWKGL
ncbi:MAG: iron-sulfur cluster assembly protein [Bacteroidota bacterium]|nr:iron-sulfur cluster assembly protein [Bacteroidota bacterium]